MKYDIPDEWVRIPKPQPEVEYRTRQDLKRAIEALLDDEGITSGLDDSAADRILVWATSQIEAAYETADRFSEVAEAIRSHARSVGRIAAMIGDGTDRSRIMARLRQLSPTIQVEDLPSDVEGGITLLLASFGGET